MCIFTTTTRSINHLTTSLKVDRAGDLLILRIESENLSAKPTVATCDYKLQYQVCTCVGEEGCESQQSSQCMYHSHFTRLGIARIFFNAALAISVTAN